MQTIPLIVTTDWLSDRLDDPKLRLIDATTLMKPLDDGNITLTSGKEAYEHGHIPGAVYADLIHELSDRTRRKPQCRQKHRIQRPYRAPSAHGKLARQDCQLCRRILYP